MIASLLGSFAPAATLRAADTTLVAITVLDVIPSYATREQLNADPSIDPVSTHYLGGADLTGSLRDAKSQVLATVKHRYFPPSLKWRSRSFAP
jgi:hypothetical protein